MYTGMRPGKAKTTAANTLVEAALRGELTEAQARRLYGLAREWSKKLVVVFRQRPELLLHDRILPG